MGLVILFVIICLSVYMINWVANIFYDDPDDIDTLEEQLLADEEGYKNENQV